MDRGQHGKGPRDATCADAIPQPANSLRFGVAKRIDQEGTKSAKESANTVRTEARAGLRGWTGVQRRRLGGERGLLVKGQGMVRR